MNFYDSHFLNRGNTVKIYAESHPAETPFSEYIAEISIPNGFEIDHIVWALLKDENREYLPYYSVKKTESEGSWGGSWENVEIILAIQNDPWVKELVLFVAGLIADKGIQKLLERIPSEEVSENKAAHHAKTTLAINLDAPIETFAVVGSGKYPRGARWVEIKDEDRVYKVVVALTRGKGTSVIIEEWKGIGTVG